MNPAGHHVLVTAASKHGASQGIAEALERALRAMRAPVGDFRDWAAVEGWAAEIAADLTVPASTRAGGG